LSATQFPRKLRIPQIETTLHSPLSTINYQLGGAAAAPSPSSAAFFYIKTMYNKHEGYMIKQGLLKNIVPRVPRREFSAAAALGYMMFCVFVAALLGIWGGFATASRGRMPALCATFVIAVLLIGVRKANEWERAVVLRFGKFRAIKGPGLYFVIPFIDRVARLVDIRIRVTDFSAQETLTLDSVTVTVDALCFWLVWDPEKAVLELENYVDAVILSSKTALRNAVSNHDLTTFLQRGDIIAKELQNEVDKKTTEWGITVQYIEITDIQIPEALQDSLSRTAQAEREKKGRVLLAEAEVEIAKRLEEAAQIYAKSEPAMKLKILSILNEGLKAGNSMMLVPHSITEELAGKDIFGLAALNEMQQFQIQQNSTTNLKNGTNKAVK
jgi:regulator of protease activity HflC (stomatin/prohibitin superfamily)